MKSLKAFTVPGLWNGGSENIIDRMNTVIFSCSLLGQIAEEHMRTKTSAESCKKRVKVFFEKVPKFGEWLMLTDKTEWENEIKKIYEETNKYGY
jgi:hypothetical protein